MPLSLFMYFLYINEIVIASECDQGLWSCFEGFEMNQFNHFMKLLLP